MEARNRTIEDWFAWVRDGAVVLPRFQRFEAWGFAQVEGILENIVRRPALPVGALLILEVGDEPPFHARPISGAPTPQTRPAYHLLDGQQRLTALWRSLTDDYEEVTFFVEAGGDLAAPEITAVRRHERRGERYPRWCDDPVQVWGRRLLPVSLLVPGEEGSQKLKTWARAASGGELDASMEIVEVAGELRFRVAGFSLPFLSLPATTDREVALDVFIKMNTQNTALTAFDIVVAQVEAAMDQSLHERVEALRARVPVVARFGDPGEIAMQVGAVLTGRAPVRAAFLAPGFGDALIGVWDRVEVGLERATAFLAEERIFDGGLLPTDPLLTLLAAYWADAPTGGDAEGAARRLARRVLWTGSFSERYQKTSATRTDLDHRQLRAYRDAGGPVPDLLSPEITPLPEAGALLTAGWPKTKDRLGRAVLAASLRVGGYDFADEVPFGPENRDRREYHHLFPKALLEAGGHPRRAVFSALNCALISWRTNRTISAKPPSVYIAERAAELEIGREEVDRRLRSHAIPVDALRSDDFDAFLMARAEMVHGLMLKLCAGEQVDLSDVAAGAQAAA